MNVRGVNIKSKQDSALALLCKHNISFVGLVETRVKCSKANSLSKAIYKNWQ